MSSAGGEPTVLTKPNRERGEDDHLWPQFLPGSKAVLFTITPTTGGVDASQVAVLDLSTGTQKILMRGGSQAQYVSSGHLIYVAADTLRAVAFDLGRLETIGSGIPVVSPVVTMPNGTAEFDIGARWHVGVRGRRPWHSARADAGLGRSPGSRRSDQSSSGTLVSLSAAVTGWNARGARDPRSGE